MHIILYHRYILDPMIIQSACQKYSYAPFFVADLMVIERPQLQTAPCILPITVTDLIMVIGTRNRFMLSPFTVATLREVDFREVGIGKA